MNQSRQLAAIMFADIVGYTSLMQEDEQLALQLRLKFKKKLEDEITTHNGRILAINGDGALCSFNSAIEGVRAAVALQLEMQTIPVVPLRIGMHTGDVVLQEDNIYGDGVNIASRLESFAVPGSIFISSRVHDDIKNQKDIQAISLGKYALKNVTAQVEIFAVSNAGITVPEVHSLTGKGQKILQKSILVLPFINMSTEPEQEYFSDGLTEEIISNLSRIKDMRVISRTTSMQYKATKKDVRTIGKEVGVNYIMEGSVRKFGSALRITAQFIDADHDTHLWAETFKGTMEDIFDIQEKVSEKIVEALKAELTKEDKIRLQKRYTENSEAYQLYLQGRYFWSKRNEPGLKAATRFFEKALEHDPHYALAWAGMADAYSLMGEYTNISRRELYPKQMAAINKALEIDSRLGEAHISLGISLMLNEWDWTNSEKEFKIGIDLNPNYATGHHWYAEWLLFTGNIKEALQEISVAVDLDPVSPGILKDKGIHYYYSRQYDEAIDMAMKTIELEPAFVPVYRLLSLAYEGKGMYNEAIAENARWGKLTGNTAKTHVALAHIYAASERVEDARQLVDNIKAAELSGNDYRGIAMVYAALRENDTAFYWLQKSYERHEESLCSLKIDPKVDNLRPDKRFSGLLKKVGLE